MLRVVLIYAIAVGCYGAVLNGHHDSRIIGGTPVDIKDYPYQVAVVNDGAQSLVCGGSIISERWVLTAAHCAGGLQVLECSPPENPFEIRVGSSSYNHGGTLYQVSLCFYHPKFNLGDDCDVGLYKTDRPIVFGASVKPIQLADKTPPVGTLVSETGWGQTATKPISEQLLMIQMPVIDHKLCEEELASVGIVTNTFFCAEKEGSILMGCHGDSGGPVTVGNVQVGITSWGHPDCSRPPTALTDVGMVRDWIKNITGI